MVEGGNLSAAIGVMDEIYKYKEKSISDHGLLIPINISFTVDGIDQK